MTNSYLNNRGSDSEVGQFRREFQIFSAFGSERHSQEPRSKDMHGARTGDVQLQHNGQGFRQEKPTLWNNLETRG